MAEKRRKYSREFKSEAVQLLNTSGKSGHEIETDLGIGRGQIYRWRRELEERAGGGKGGASGVSRQRESSG